MQDCFVASIVHFREVYLATKKTSKQPRCFSSEIMHFWLNVQFV